MIAENDSQTLNRMLATEQAALKAAHEAFERATSEMATRAANIAAIRRLLGEESAGVSVDQKTPSNTVVKTRDPRKGTIGDWIRLLFEASPQITSTEVIEVIKKKCREVNRKTKIDETSFRTWDSYFKTGRLRMDVLKYMQRYGQDVPYEKM